jgi:hypothetical protein
MLALVLLLAAAQSTCSPDAQQLLRVAAERAEQPDLIPAINTLQDPVARGCGDAEIARLYLRGLVDAREAFRQGALPSSLVPVRTAIDALDQIARGQPGPAEVARLMLQAAAAAAQSERGEMALYLAHADSMDALLRAAGKPALPVLTVAEVSGELWLQLYSYDEAEAAFKAAARQVGQTPRVVAGLARIAAAR